MKRVFTAVLLFLWMALPPLRAQEGYHWFHHIQAPEDIRAVYPDQTGRVWFGTSRGLFRYDDFPYEIHYELYPEEFQNGINDVSSFGDGRLVVRTRRGLLYVYDPESNQAESLETYVNRWGVEARVSREDLFLLDPLGGIWLSCSSALYRKLPQEDKLELMARLHGPIQRFDTDGDRFCAVTDSLLFVSSVNHPEKAWELPHGMDLSRSHARLSLDREGSVWLGGHGLYRFSAEGQRKEQLLENVTIMDVLRSRSGDILVASGIEGVYVFGPDGRERQHLVHRSFEPGTLSSNNVRSIREGADGALWVCYTKPFVSVSMPGSTITPSRHILPLLQAGLEENVIAMAQAPDGKVWYGTDGQGLFCLDGRSGKFDVPAISLSQASVTSLFFDSRGRAWVGTFMGGLYCQDGGRVTRFLPGTSCSTIMEDRSGTIWAGMSGQGVFRIPGDLKGEPVQVDLKEYRWVNQILEGKDGQIYAATINGIVTIQPQTLETSPVTGTRSGRQTLSNTYFTSLVQDSRGLLWASGTRSDFPLEIIDPVRDTILYIPGLEKQNIKSIVEDADRNIWLSAEQSVIQVIVNFSSRRQQYTFHPFEYRLRETEALSGSHNLRAAVRLSDGALLFGKTAGYQRIEPSAFPPHTPLPAPPVLSVTAYKAGDSYHWVNDAVRRQGLRLGPNQNNVSLILSAQDYTSPFQTSILYRLGNDDTGWKPVRGKVIELMHLSPGHYSLEVSNGNPDGSLAGAVLPFSIEIKAPWYRTRWAAILFALLIVGFVGLIAYYYLDRQRKQISLAQIQQEAERQHQLNEMKLRFFTNISHDFRTPLSLIITPLETYLNDDAHKAEEPFLRPVYRNAVRLLNLVNQILDFRKLEADNVSLHFSYGNLVPFLRDICSSFVQFADETGKKIVFLPEQEEILTAFDKDKLSKILMNLLSNAFKFSPEKGTVTVRLSATDASYTLSVEDNGPGIPDGQKEEVFQRFYQYQSGESTYIGSGIGLHIVREFVNMLGGSVTVTDNQPCGSVFTVNLPLRDKEEARADIPEETAGEELPDKPVPAGKRLLLVEDNKDFRDFMRDQLSDEFQVFTAREGKEALDILEKEDVDIIISDIMMEGMDGLELCRAVKNNLATSHIPLILLTAKALAEDEIQGLQLGADDYVTKPFHMQILRLRIRKLLEARLQSQRQFSEKLEVNPSEITITSLDEQFLSKAIHLTEENMADQGFSVEKLSSMLGLHRANLYKKLLSITGKTPVEFIRTIRLKRAAQYLLKSQLYISEIAYEVGFNSPKLFSRHFRSEFGMTPREYQKQHGIGTSPEEEEDLDETWRIQLL